MKTLLIGSLAILLAGCQSRGPLYSGGDGSAIEQAVIITGAIDNTEGVKAEYAWLRSHYPGYKHTGHRVRRATGRIYQQLNIVTADGQPQAVFFDITSFHGRGFNP